MSIKNNLFEVKNKINQIKLDSARENIEVELLAVSKTKPLEFLLEAYEAGQRLFGENRIIEAESKVPLMPKDTQFHMIGHLQSNKVSKACKYFSCIQSVDSLKIAKKINSCCGLMGKVMDVYLEVNIVNDPKKSGFSHNEQFYNDFKEIVCFENINILGLMCIGAHVNDRNSIKKSFSDLKKLLNDLRVKFPQFTGNQLSMGMSNDFKEAIEEGSTLVRVGSSIFGQRN